MSNNYCYIPPEQKRHVIKLAAKGWKPQQIADALDMGVSTVKRVQRLWNTTAFVVVQPATNGRPALLSSLDLEVGTMA
jgi:transposase